MDHTAAMDLQYWASLGVGGILAGMMFAFYRNDVRLFTEQWKGATEMLVEHIKANTIINTKILTLLEEVGRKLDRGDRHGSSHVE